MKYVLEYHEHRITDEATARMREFKQTIVEINPISVYREFCGYSLTMFSRSPEKAEEFLKSINAYYDSFSDLWKVGD
ncbi:hypothetical protein GuL6_084 [Buttiauxella phage vB_ButM_GuL6]|nr:hypothetical protein GuL6_084 [Buttiauxella phage vB_ButM_GuL6]